MRANKFKGNYYSPPVIYHILHFPPLVLKFSKFPPPIHKYNQFHFIKIGMEGGKLENFKIRGEKMENTENYRGRMIITLSFNSLLTYEKTILPLIC